MVDFSSWLSSAGRLAAAGLLVATLSACGNSGGSALLGGAAGAAAGAGGFEYHLNQQMKKVEEDYEKGRIDRDEYEIRKDQIKRDSLIQ
ncbi:MAG: hypothetical protein KDE35_07705 [Geminicoccaceae bacterium]|nr:hypothetical protein [Geminicoccaceae bacterium]